MKILAFLLLLTTPLVPVGMAQAPNAAPAGATQVKTANGIVEGRTEKSGVRSFKGVPFAQPPVGALRWQAPQPAQPWQGVRRLRLGPGPCNARFLAT